LYSKKLALLTIVRSFWKIYSDCTARSQKHVVAFVCRS